MLEIIKAHAVKNLCYIAFKKMNPKGIVVHSTGANNPNLKRYVDAPSDVGVNRYSNHWNVAKPGGSKVCVHAFIGYDKDKNIKVAEILPLDRCCWGVGKGKNGSDNYDPASIQLEICEDSLTDKNYYNQVFNTAAEYCAVLCKEFNIDVEKIVGHCEAYRLGYGSNHCDPEHWMKKFGENMSDFRKRVSELLKADNTPVEINNTDEVFNNTVESGVLVTISADATYYNGKSIPSWVMKQKWYVRGKPVGSRAVIDKNEDKTNSICSPIDIKFLTVVKKGG